jgi:hypothetical protein
MAKFIRIKDSLINVDKVTNFELSVEEIWVFFDDGSNPLNIFCANEHEARLIFEDIPHLIDNNHIPAFVREHQLNELKFKADRAEARAVFGAMDNSNWDELPF